VQREHVQHPRTRRVLVRRVLAAALLSLALFGAWLFAVWPPPSWYRTHWPSETAFMAMRERGGERGGDSARVRRYRPVPLDSVALAMQQATLIAEDHNFLRHSGLDYGAIRSALGYRRNGFAWDSEPDRDAMWRALGSIWRRRDALRGASTITQQLAKNLYLSPSRNPLRKVKEAVTAWRLEGALGKRRILELYLNVAELGDGVWGVEAASQRYYRTSARELTRGQAAALAGSLPFPLSSNPDRRPMRMQRRQSLILRRMRGERLEIPREPEVEAAPAERSDTLERAPGIDSLLDSLRGPVDTVTPADLPAAE
jgi:monofunctional glycosyltransferase